MWNVFSHLFRIYFFDFKETAYKYQVCTIIDASFLILAILKVLVKVILFEVFLVVFFLAILSGW